MALREFVDNRGRRWTVWDVHSTLVNYDQKNVSRSTTSAEPPPDAAPRVELPAGAALSWLAFEAHDGERRRLIPIPVDAQWFDASEQQLCTWCEMARQLPPTRRLIE